VICPICLHRVNVHTEDQAVQCYTLYLKRAYDDPIPSPAFAQSLHRDAVYA